MKSLFSATEVGSTSVKNRVFMAPLTRNRADNDTDIPSELATEYYRQRSSSGLIIAEGTQISQQAKGYVGTPGIYTDRQVAQWQQITDAVHQEGGKIFLQLWHVGRISHSAVLPENQSPLAPSPIRANAQTFVNGAMEDVSQPVAMTQEDIDRTLADYQMAAECAFKAGFDGVEIHAANGYLIDQFLRDGSNRRSDDYGGSIQRRCHFLEQVIESVCSVWKAERVGIRLSPTGTFNDAHDSDPLALFTEVISTVSRHHLAYLHMVEQFPGFSPTEEDVKILSALRKQWRGFYIANGDYDLDRANTALASGHADAISFGRPYIANPDLALRLKIGADLNSPDESTFYGGGAEGYIDYPFLDGSIHRSDAA